VYRHQRDILCGPSWWVVVDSVDGTFTNPLTSNLHFHPEVKLHSDDSEYHFQRADAAVSGVIRLLGTESVSRTTSPYFPRFGDQIERSMLRCRYDQSSECMGFLITTGIESDIEVRSTSGSVVVTVGDQCYEFDRTGPMYEKHQSS